MVTCMNEIVVIKCPSCGREYLPVEIYVPSAFFGNPDVIKRDTEGHIVGVVGKSLDTKETFTCEGCNTKFKIDASINFSTIEEKSNETFDTFVSRNNVKYTVDEF